MPVYNAERYLPDSVESILAQSFSNFEFLIFDDGSTDRSLQILQTYSEQDARIRVFARPHRGYVPWLNEGIRIARGEFIARMDADDIAMPDRFACQVKYMGEHPSCVAVGCDCLAIDPDGADLHRIGYDRNHKLDEDSLLNGESEGLAHPTAMLRRETLVGIGGYREQYEFLEDYDLWFRLLEKGQLGVIPRVLLKHRLHCNSVSHGKADQQKQMIDVIITEHRMRRGLRPLAYSAWRYETPATPIEAHRWWGNLAAANGHYRTALKHATISLRGAPLSPKSWFALWVSVCPRILRRLLQTALASARLWNETRAQR
ncbi:MAG: glycosyl transferase family 2 [Chloroflexi bacterium]|nr:MAG: glycosyl transferase family 2 [Chloroflexota bacterium]